jgi:MATE family multidrug resistance protein
MAYLAFTDPTVVKPQWPPRPEVYSRERIIEFFRIGIPSVISTCSEWWVFELLNVIAAGISTLAVDSLNIMFGVSLWVFAMSYGWSAATGALVGNELGAGRGIVAGTYARIGLVSTFITATFFAVVVLILSPWILQLYTSDADALTALHKMLLPLFFFCVCDGGRYTLQSICRGAGRQVVAARVVLFSLWAIGLPGSYILGARAGGGAVGLFVGFTLGFAFEVPWLTHEMNTWSWTLLAEEAAKTSSAAPATAASSEALEVAAIPAADDPGDIFDNMELDLS